MKINLIVLLFFVSSLYFAQTYHSISIDGTLDFSTVNEEFNTSSTLSNTWSKGYVTWDATHLYFGILGASNSGNITDNNRVIHIYIDTDPQPSPTNGTGTTTGEIWKWTPTLPFTANYHYAFKTLDNSEYKRVYSGGAWSNATLTTANWKNSTASYWELSILLSDIGAPSKIYFLAYVEEDWNWGWIGNGVPSNVLTDVQGNGSGSNNITFASHWLGFTLTSGVNPNNQSNFDVALPVVLTSFTAAASGKNVELNWATATEVNNYGFEIQRSNNLQGQGTQNGYSNLEGYKKICFVQGHGNSNSPRNYSFTDENVSFGKYNYRLKQIDTDGKFEYSNVVEVEAGEIPNGFVLEQNYPNPFNPSTTIRYGLPFKSNVRVEIFNLLGQRVKILANRVMNAGIHSTLWNAANLASGIYIIRINAASISGNANYIKSIKMQLLK